MRSSVRRFSHSRPRRPASRFLLAASCPNRNHFGSLLFDCRAMTPANNSRLPLTVAPRRCLKPPGLVSTRLSAEEDDGACSVASVHDPGVVPTPYFRRALIAQAFEEADPKCHGAVSRSKTLHGVLLVCTLRRLAPSSYLTLQGRILHHQPIQVAKFLCLRMSLPRCLDKRRLWRCTFRTRCVWYPRHKCLRCLFRH